ncbi:MAG: DNA polymerase III subunit delta [Actinomycetes bacterium]
MPVQTPAPTASQLILVTGSEEFLVERATRSLVQDWRSADPDLEVHDLEVEDLHRGDLAVLVSPSLFGGAPVVVLNGIERLKADSGDLADAVDEITAYLAAPSPDARVVLVHRGGNAGKAVLTAARKAGAVELTTAAPRTRSQVQAHREQFVRDEFSGRERSIERDGVTALLDALGTDLRDLAAACAQLAADVPGRLDRDAVSLYYAGRAETSGFTVVDALLDGNTASALALARQLVDSGTDPVPVVAAVAKQLRTLARVASAPRGVSPASLARELGVGDFAIKRARAWAPAWTPVGLATAIRAAAATDEAVKGGEAQRAYALERLLVTVGRARTARS